MKIPIIETGEKIVLLEVFEDLGANAGIGTIDHKITRIGLWCRESEFAMTNMREGSFGRPVSPMDSFFPHLPPSLLATGGHPLTDFGGGKVGLEFDTLAKEPGVYSIMATWRVLTRGSAIEMRLSSAPLILFVKPSPAWLRDNDAGRKGDTAKRDSFSVQLQAESELHMKQNKSAFIHLSVGSAD